MNNNNDELLKGLETGFINRSTESNPALTPQILTNDSTKNKKVLSSLQNELRNCDAFWFNVAFVTSGGVATIINELKELERKGVKGKILVSQYQNFTQPEALIRLLQFKNIELKIVTEGNMHAKGYLFKKGEMYNYIVGSSNLTDNALKVNQELNIKITATKESNIIFNTLVDFEFQFTKASIVNSQFLEAYYLIYRKQLEQRNKSKVTHGEISNIIKPNKMQIEALNNLDKIRSEGKSKALLISATGTGKTYLSAFDVKKLKPKKLLFIVHRRTIAEKSMESFREILGNSVTMGMYSGQIKEIECDYLFSTIQTISKEEEFKKFTPEEFDYIVIDETHRAGAESYKRIMSYFKPKFLLGMTATPERTDGYDIYNAFEHTIAYEIRLHKALEEDMLSPFHYYGITDLTINNNTIDDKSDFNKLTSSERIKHIVHNIKFYGCDNGEPRGLIFCSRTEEAIKLSELLNKEGLKTISLTGESAEHKRKETIHRLETTDIKEKLDYIITVDIFNEGVDIPKVNQVIMLRPTQSAIIFVQQLGRGLRKADNKEYLTVIDFIGNYSNNFLVPIALFGDNTYNKDNLRKLMYTGSDSLPGASTVSFDEISKKKIFESIDNFRPSIKKELAVEYLNLKFKIGKIPMMCDFVKHGNRDPYNFIKEYSSYYNFISLNEKGNILSLDSDSNFYLEFLAKEINNYARVEECMILKYISTKIEITIEELQKYVFDKYHYIPTKETIISSINNLNLKFITISINNKLVPLSTKYNFDIISVKNEKITAGKSLLSFIKNPIFNEFMLDNIEYSILKFDEHFFSSEFNNGFIYYKKYTRKDVFRILNWDQNPLAQNVGGYMISSNKKNCAIYVNYHKSDDTADSIKYLDGFIDNSTFKWMSKNNRYLTSPDVAAISNSKVTNMRLPLFINKSKNEGNDLYYVGDLSPILNEFKESEIDGKPVVTVIFKLNKPVEENLYNYLTANI